MNTYKWTCLACKSPNVLVHDESKEGQIALNCKQCGEPGVFEPEEQRIRMSPGFPHAYTHVDTCSTETYNPVLPIEIDYADPSRIVKVPVGPTHWRK